MVQEIRQSQSIEFRRSADPQSLDILKGERRIGMLLWHEGNHRVVFTSSNIPLVSLNITDLEDILSTSQKIRDGLKPI